MNIVYIYIIIIKFEKIINHRKPHRERDGGPKLVKPTKLYSPSQSQVHQFSTTMNQQLKSTTFKNLNYVNNSIGS